MVTSRAASWVVWPVAFLAVALLVGMWVSNLAGLGIGADTELYEAAWVLSWIGFPVVGAVIASRRPAHPVGWLLVGAGFGIAVGLAGNVYAYEGLVAQRAVPAPGMVLWISQMALIVAFSFVPFLILTFPSGRVPSARMRRVARAGGFVFALLLCAYGIRSVLELGEGKRVPNPFGVPVLAGTIEVVVPVLFVAALLFGLLVMGHAVWRLRRSDGLERRQLKWFAYAAGTFPLLMAVGQLAWALSFPFLGDVLITGAFFVSLNGMAVAIGFAILRYRLYDIDRIVSRTLAYALVIVILAGAYASVVVGLGSMLRPLTGGGDVAVAVSTLLVAAAFRPLSRRVRTMVDRRFNRSRYDAARTIESFSARLRDEIVLDDLRLDLESVVHRAVQPAQVRVWIRQGGRT